MLALQLSNLNYSIVLGKNNLYNYSKYFQTGLFFKDGCKILNNEMLKSLGHKMLDLMKGFNCLPTSVDGAESK